MTNATTAGLCKYWLVDCPLNPALATGGHRVLTLIDTDEQQGACPRRGAECGRDNRGDD